MMNKNKNNSKFEGVFFTEATIVEGNVVIAFQKNNEVLALEHYYG